jgi:DNA-binding MarR family transcriptional regulator
MIVALLDGAGPLSTEVIGVEVGVSQGYAAELMRSLIDRGYLRRSRGVAFAYETTGAWDPDDDVRAR